MSEQIRKPGDGRILEIILLNGLVSILAAYYFKKYGFLLTGKWLEGHAGV